MPTQKLRPGRQSQPECWAVQVEVPKHLAWKWPEGRNAREVSAAISRLRPQRLAYVHSASRPALSEMRLPVIPPDVSGRFR
jgi:hypothetical protein